MEENRKFMSRKNFFELNIGIKLTQLYMSNCKFVTKETFQIAAAIASLI